MYLRAELSAAGRGWQCLGLDSYLAFATVRQESTMQPGPHIAPLTFSFSFR